MKFRFVADIEFESDSAETAARKIAAHFNTIALAFAEKWEPPVEEWFLGELHLGLEDSPNWKVMKR